MMRLLQNTFRVSFVEKNDLKILEVCVHIEMSYKTSVVFQFNFAE